jgi:hypothetical protein
MQLEYREFDLTEKTGIILNEQQLRPFNIALQEIDLRFVLHEGVEIDEVDPDSLPRGNVDGRIFHMQRAVPDNPTTARLSNQSLDHADAHCELLGSNPLLEFQKCFRAALTRRNVGIEALPFLPADKIQNSKREKTDVGAKIQYDERPNRRSALKRRANRHILFAIYEDFIVGPPFTLAGNFQGQSRPECVLKIENAIEGLVEQLALDLPISITNLVLNRLRQCFNNPS